jgi:hypothetical protein
LKVDDKLSKASRRQISLQEFARERLGEFANIIHSPSASKWLTGESLCNQPAGQDIHTIILELGSVPGFRSIPEDREGTIAFSDRKTSSVTFARWMNQDPRENPRYLCVGRFSKTFLSTI